MSEEQNVNQTVSTEHDCCQATIAEEPKDQTAVAEKTEGGNQPNAPKKAVAILGYVLAGLLLINIAVMGMFTFNISRKFGQAVALTQPQAGSLTLVSPLDCPQCGDLAAQKQAIKSMNVEITEDQSYAADSEQGKKLIAELKLQQLPALVFRAEKPTNNNVVQSLSEGSRQGGEGVFIWEKSQPPYVDAASGAKQGLVDVIYITDASCAGCYDVVAVQRPILQRFGMALASERTVDVASAEGKELKSAYSLTGVPTMILSSEANKYVALVNVWGQVGTIEPDGKLVFRQVDVLGVKYKNLTTGKVITPPVDSAK